MNYRTLLTVLLNGFAGALLLGAVAHGPVVKADGPNHGGGVYQRRSSNWNRWHGGDYGGGWRKGPQWTTPQVNSGWYQRPYPYHLDYYKMRYGGSYAPYFGNLYGTPQVVTAPPYFGPYGPVMSGYEWANPGDGAFGVQMPMMPNDPAAEMQFPYGAGLERDEAGAVIAEP